jgi:RNA-directed DNA polymerase
MALDGMQAAIRQAVSPRGDKVNFVRYADDFVVTGANRQILEQKVQPALTAFLRPRGLELSEQKTVLTPIHKGFDFLGHTVRKFGDKLLCRPAKRSVQALRDKLRRCFQSALGLSQEALIRQLNPILRGWANYYRYGAAKRTFIKLDHYVFRKLWRWTARRHPNKSATWRKRKYFSAAGKNGGFSVRLPKAKGESRVLSLYRMASTKIQRHIKVKGLANPFDPHYEEYFEKRRCFAWRTRDCKAVPSASPSGPPTRSSSLSPSELPPRAPTTSAG